MYNVPYGYLNLTALPVCVSTHVLRPDPAAWICETLEFQKARKNTYNTKSIGHDMELACSDPSGVSAAKSIRMASIGSFRCYLEL